MTLHKLSKLHNKESRSSARMLGCAILVMLIVAITTITIFLITKVL